MRCTLLMTAMGLIVAPAVADAQFGRVAGMKSLGYDCATGEISADPSLRIGNPIWATNVDTGYFYVIYQDDPNNQYTVLDWGDIADGTEVGGFWFSYFGVGDGAGGPGTGSMHIFFHGEENGFNSYMRTSLAGFFVSGLPDLPPPAPNGYYGWLITVDLEPNLTFTITGSDIDGDGLTDFGWSQHVSCGDWDNAFMGPLIQAPSTTPGMEGTGSENVFDQYFACSASGYDGSYWFGGTPWASFSMILYDLNGFHVDCLLGGASGNYCDADIDGSADCEVQLNDLAKLLGNYGATSGVTHDDGDLEPAGGDGDVDLADLAVLLGQYGDICHD